MLPPFNWLVGGCTTGALVELRRGGRPVGRAKPRDRAGRTSAGSAARPPARGCARAPAWSRRRASDRPACRAAAGCCRTRLFDRRRAGENCCAATRAMSSRRVRSRRVLREQRALGPASSASQPNTRRDVGRTVERRRSAGHDIWTFIEGERVSAGGGRAGPAGCCALRRGP